MRVLIDENDLPWERAWEITQATLGYTNHTLLPEALEKWPVSLFEHVLPRHLQIIYEINRRFLEHVAGMWPDDTGALAAHVHCHSKASTSRCAWDIWPWSAVIR